MILRALVVGALCISASFVSLAAGEQTARVQPLREPVTRVLPPAVQFSARVEAKQPSNVEDDALMLVLKSKSFADEMERSVRAFCAKAANAGNVHCIQRNSNTHVGTSRQ
jgi:hypothetical protein